MVHLTNVAGLSVAEIHFQLKTERLTARVQELEDRLNRAQVLGGQLLQILDGGDPDPDLEIDELRRIAAIEFEKPY